MPEISGVSVVSRVSVVSKPGRALPAILLILLLALSVHAAAAADTPQFRMEYLWEFGNSPDRVTCADISPDSNRIVAAGDRTISMLGRDGRIIWNRNYDDTIRDVSTTVDGRNTAFVTQNGYVYMLDGDGQIVYIKTPGGSPFAVDVTEDAKHTVVGTTYGPIYMLDKSGNVEWKQGFSGVLKGVAASDYGDVVAAATDDGVVFAYYNTGTQRWSKSMNVKATCVDVSPNGDIVAVGLANGDVVRFDSDTGEEIFRDTLPFVPKSVSLSEKGTDMAVSGDNSATVYYFSLDFRNFEPITVKADGTVRSVELSKPANNMAVVSDSGTLTYYYRYSTTFVQPTPEVTTIPEVSYEVNVLVIESNPKGAQVLIDNRIAGITPITLTDVSSGPHVLLIRHDGYQDWTREFSLGSGATVTISADMLPKGGDDFPWIPVIIGVVAIIAVVAFIIWRRNRVDYNYLF